MFKNTDHTFLSGKHPSSNLQNYPLLKSWTLLSAGQVKFHRKVLRLWPMSVLIQCVEDLHAETFILIILIGTPHVLTTALLIQWIQVLLQYGSLSQYVSGTSSFVRNAVHESLLNCNNYQLGGNGVVQIEESVVPKKIQCGMCCSRPAQAVVVCRSVCMIQLQTQVTLSLSKIFMQKHSSLSFRMLIEDAR